MNNQVKPESKEAAIKTLAIIGFIVAIVASIWLAVQIVRLVPSAWTSLASLAESVYGDRQILTVAVQKTIVNSGEVLEVSWTRLRNEGSYVWSYRCTEGVSAEARTAAGDIVGIDCEENLSLDPSTQSVEIIFTSEKKRFIDVPFSVSFIPRKDADSAQDKNELVTVVNAAIAQSGSITVDTETPDEETEGETPSSGGQAGGGTTGGTSGVITTKPITTTYFPTSNPNGYTDLKATYLGIGAFNKSTGVFTPVTQIDNDVRSAVRFEVKNIGTKTSGTWKFEADLFGFDFESNSQIALRPNERAVITLGFDEITTETGTENIKIEVTGGGDISTANNSFDWAIKIVD